MAQYTVRTGDTLYIIARRYNTTVERILELNPSITNPNIISVGQVIVVPDGGVTTPAPSPTGRQNTRVVNGLLYRLSTDRLNYRQGEDITLTFVKCNITNRTITLNYDTSQRYDFAAYRDGREVWRWSRDRVFSQVRGRVTLGPGECRTYRVVWNQLNNQGRQVAADDFEIRAFNVARGFADQAIEQSIRILPRAVPTPTPTPAPQPCPSTNILVNNSFEDWPPNESPTGWQINNVARTNLQYLGRFAAEMGRRPGSQATLSQTVSASARRIYQLEFYARENAGTVSRYQLRAEVFFYNRAGQLVGRADPIISEAAIPNNSYQLYRLTTGITPGTTARAEVRFTFIPAQNNDSRVKIDSVSFFCIR
ncbi:BsuPI-related putative proteinase inhibitor [Desulfolucanica intricata]|uniref:BsuPI-related putative proteinase inhibitor n=1 Tax=Desulfolucanica intricata TaxID=1285191 RepID=UPI0008371C75|nr:BsuPI-related putative proteinase inhibitor [Desulfolucanica intricata]